MGINTQHADYTKMVDKWDRCNTTAKGQDAVHEAGEKYLPKLKDQTTDDYNAYVMRAVFYNATWRTISGLTGMIMRIPPATVVPTTIEPMLDDITLSGVPLSSFAQTIVEESLKVGRVGILVDCPTVQTNGTLSAPTLADAQGQNIRPTMQMYVAGSIINWRITRINNAQVLSLVVLEECESVQVDEWTTKEEKRWRELALEEGVYRVRVYKRENEVDILLSEVFPKMNNTTMDYIPFTFISTDDLTPEVDEPPLIDLVDMNLAHYRVTADYEHGCHFTGLPTAVVSGYVRTDVTEKLYIGSSTAWVFPDPAARASYLEFSGQGLTALVENLKNKEQQMAVLGARMLEAQIRGVQAPEAMSIHRKGEEAMLSAIAQTVSIGIQQALIWFIDWVGADTAAVDFELNHDFYPMPMDPQMLSAMLSAWQMGAPGFSDQELFAKFKQGELIVEDVTLEEEQARIADRQIQISQMAGTAGAP